MSATGSCYTEFRTGKHISTPRLNSLRSFYLEPINLVISESLITIPNLGARFPLICFQRLSDIASGAVGTTAGRQWSVHPGPLVLTLLKNQRL
jgi:hypothetical protein